MNQTQSLTLRQKLFEIQKRHQTFAQTEDSAKKTNGKTGKSAYTYTPGWRIVESVRKAMDDMGIMLDSSQVGEEHEMISYYVYKEIAGQIVPFEKKEMYVTVKREYTWVDVASGEKLGPFLQTAAGANGTDKSIASAESLCQRYFILKYFNITTREMDEEPDAHDSSAIPGNVNYPDAAEYDAGRGYRPVQQPMRQTAPQGYGRGAQQAQMTPNPARTKEDLYNSAAAELANFGTGTQSHNIVLNKWLTSLNQAGYNTSDPSFTASLIEAAQAIRGRSTPAGR